MTERTCSLHSDLKIRTIRFPTIALLARGLCWLRGLDLNQRPSGYEPDELPDCSTPRYPSSSHVWWRRNGLNSTRCPARSDDLRPAFAGSAAHCKQVVKNCHVQIHILSDVRSANVHGRPGGVLLSHALRRSTIGAEGFHGRVRDGIGCRPLAMTTRPSMHIRRTCALPGIAFLI